MTSLLRNRAMLDSEIFTKCRYLLVHEKNAKKIKIEKNAEFGQRGRFVKRVTSY